MFVLDLDDTLILEKDFVFSGFTAVGDWLRINEGVDHFRDTAWGLFLQGLRSTIFNRALDDLGRPYSEATINKLVTIYRSHIPDIKLQPDALVFLEKYKISTLALITDGYAETQWNKIRALGLDKHIDKIIVTDDWGQEFWKPHERAFVKVSKGYPNEACIYIGDNPYKDFIAPQRLGWGKSIRVRRKESLHFNVPTPCHCREVYSLDQL